MIRSSSRYSRGPLALPAARLRPFAIPFALGACASRSEPGRQGPAFATATELPEGPRRPDGVVVDPSPELPRALEAAIPSSVLVALQPPLPEKAARTVVAAFFRAI